MKFADDDPLLERVARAICEADGLDPDARYETGKLLPGEADKERGKEAETRPNWVRFCRQARLFLAAHEALTGPR